VPIPPCTLTVRHGGRCLSIQGYGLLQYWVKNLGESQFLSQGNLNPLAFSLGEDLDLSLAPCHDYYVEAQQKALTS